MTGNEKKKAKKYDILHILSSAICDMAAFPKKMIKYATPATLCLIVLGTVLFVSNRTGNDYSSIFEVTTTTLITNSFFVLAEFLIASFVIDILIKKRAQ